MGRSAMRVPFKIEGSSARVARSILKCVETVKSAASGTKKENVPEIKPVALLESIKLNDWAANTGASSEKSWTGMHDLGPSAHPSAIETQTTHMKRSR
jgi:hypothetical protein